MKTLKKQELKERIEEVLRMVEEEGKTIEVTNQGRVVALHNYPLAIRRSRYRASNDKG
ncbi:MAG: type II toxin-antitoxin system prevent-host-death family antitoxin [Chloroflexi bacterium]|nr:type II toxin-antitoxin system prevent-host-death family antitoxin [Ktedonobacteraceae bacterium]MBV9706637.1 type II toxin-antitoxin system prevent-host-death family antitoxin [Chloroflexota bacterium]